MSQPSPLRSETDGSGVRTGRAAPLSQYVLKLASRCDLACDHCYVYQHPDQSWRRQPRIMAPATVTMAAKRVAEHAATHRLESVRVVLHGGEPLLAGPAVLRSTADELRRWIEPVTGLDLRMQSNGLLLSPEICDILVRHEIKIGISLDGDAAANDRHRRHANGASSHAQVRQALELLRRPEYREAYAGLLCTVDLANDPIGVYEALLAEDPPQIDFLLPHHNWDRPPVRPAGEPTPYARWLLAIHRRWSADGRPVRIRLLDSLLATAAGGVSRTEAVGLGPADLAVVETDGTYEQVDSLKSAFDGAAGTGLDVFRHPVDDVAAHPMIAVRQLGLSGLSATCRECAVVRQCGGGLFPHRYRSATGFENPSVYCADLKELITSMPVGSPASTTVPDRLTAADSLSERVLDDLGSGRGTEESVLQLPEIQLSMIRGMLRDLAESAVGTPLAERGWELLAHLDESAPDAVRVVLDHPFVRSWAASRGGGSPRPTASDLRYLGCLAAAAAIHAGYETDVEVPVRDGVLNLPTVGALTLGPDVGTALLSVGKEHVRVRADDHSVTIRPGRDGNGPAWRPPFRVPVGNRSLLVEDTDPYRDCYGTLTVAEHLSPAATLRWADELDRAIRLIDEEAPGYAPGVRALLHAVVPLRPAPGGGHHSASAAVAPGAVAITPVPDDKARAVLLVHEVQHLKLNAMLDVCDLYDPAETRRVSVGWREEPRPVGGVLHGIYAHLAVADVWRGWSGPVAHGHFRQYREWTGDALDNLTKLGVLTPAGERFAARMRETLDSWS
ncbi:FxsB family cyclophane-forming radical SAM/SPASM peptide maturase [Plantactinospora sonchi]|uniref:FxsB family cyclophane-forming radical SAM/SPASM peptide maturase n=1 Tax=Plantactinospora sonchi TaxID=1544735 RepID=A0ABU7S3S9_9ACTN